MFKQTHNIDNLKKYPISVLAPKGSGAVSVVRPLNNTKSGFSTMERWKDINGLEGRYQISNYGRVKSLQRFVYAPQCGGSRKVKERILRPRISKKGYCTISLNKKDGGFASSVHRLVAVYFIPNPEDKPQVNHKDENPSNNNILNLEWCTRSYNINYGTCKERIGKANKNQLSTSKKTAQYSKKGKLIKIYPSQKEAQRDGFLQTNISACCLGKRKTAGGFIWKNI